MPTLILSDMNVNPDGPERREYHAPGYSAPETSEEVSMRPPAQTTQYRAVCDHCDWRKHFMVYRAGSDKDQLALRRADKEAREHAEQVRGHRTRVSMTQYDVAGPTHCYPSDFDSDAVRS